MSPSPSSSPSSSTSPCYTASVSSRRWSSSPSSSSSSSWFHFIFFTGLLYILLFSAACCEAVPVWKSGPQTKQHASSNNNGANVISAGSSSSGYASRIGSDSVESDSTDSILRQCLSGEGAEQSVFIKTLCSLAMMRSLDDSRTSSHEGFVKRASDRTAFSAFNRFVHTLVQHANEVSDYQERLNRMQELGLLDHDYNVISVPHETKQLMQQLG